MEGKTIGIVAIKGGVGKTTTVINLAYVMANEFGKKVLVVDGNFSAPNVHLHLGIAETTNNLHRVLNDEVLVSDAVYHHVFGFDFLPGSADKVEVNPYKLKQKLKPLRKKYDVILIDSSPSGMHELRAVMLASDGLFVVTNPDKITLN